MISISRKTIYGVAALYQLSLQKKDAQLSIKEIAMHANTPQRFLEQILLELKKHGILKSTKGIHGGYSLLKPLDKITLKEIVLTLENNTDPAPCKTGNPVLDHFWKERHREAMHTMDIPLSQLDGHHIDPAAIHEEKRETPYEI